MQKSHKIKFNYFDQHCCLEINPFKSTRNHCVYFSYGSTLLYIFIVRNQILDKSDENHSIKRFKIIYEEKGYANNIISMTRHKREVYNDKSVLIARQIDKSVRTNFPDTVDKYDINVFVINDSGNIDLACMLGVNLALKFYFKEFDLSVPFKIDLANHNAYKGYYNFIVNTEKDCDDTMLLSVSSQGINYVELNTLEHLDLDLFSAEIQRMGDQITYQINNINEAYENYLINLEVREDFKWKWNDKLTVNDVNITSDDYYVAYECLLSIMCDIFNIDNIFSFLKPLYDRMLFNLTYGTSFKTLFNNHQHCIALVCHKLVINSLRKYYMKCVLDPGAEPYEIKKRFDERTVSKHRDLDISCIPHNNTINITMQKNNTIVYNTCSISEFDKFIYDANKIICHYNFSQFAVDSAYTNSNIKRRSVGHGYIIENALKSVFKIQSNNTFRFVSEVLSADGSTSLVSVMATSLLAHIIDKNTKLLTAISFGIVKDENDNVVLVCDITELEDHFCVCDIKLIYTEDGKIVGIRVDSKESLLSLCLLLELVKRGLKVSKDYLDTCDKWLYDNTESVNIMRTKTSIQMNRTSHFNRKYV